jgi:hypothetical protein
MTDVNETMPTTPEVKQLAPDTPVAKDVLMGLQRLQQSRMSLGERLLDLEAEKVRLLAAVQRLDNEKTRVFEGILMERGLPPNSVVEIDAETGAITDPRKRVNIPQPPPANS